jgi:hypothetical protein
MPSKLLQRFYFATFLLAATVAHAQDLHTKDPHTNDLHIKKSVTVGGNFVSTTETSIKGARERSVTQTPSGSSITLRQCDLKRTLTLNEQAQTYLAINDPQDENAAKAAALATGMPAAEATGGKITVTTTITDTGERKTMYGYPARHLKAKVVQEPSPDACTQVRQSFDIDGWFADISKEQSACATIAPPVQQANGCNDRVISKRVGSGKPGYPLQESITMPNPDGTTMTVGVQVSELSKQQLPAELFDVPAGYRQVNSLAELNGAVSQQVAQQAPQQAMAPQMQAAVPQSGAGQVSAANGMKATMLAATFNPAAAPAAQMKANAMAQQTLGMLGGTQMGPGMMGPGQGQPAANQVAAPQALGPKAPGKIRIGVAPPDAQVGQGSNAGGDYSTPIRNAEIALMSGPAIEIAALDSHVPMQLQAEAQQKQCDYILLSSVLVKHSSGGGFGKFMKMAAPVASMTPMAGMGRGMGGAVAAQAAGAAASAAAMSAQQQAMNQLSGFNGQIKSKDDVTVEYQLFPTGQSQPAAHNALKAKAKSDGEDVLTPLLQQTADNVLGAVTKK